MIATLQRTPIGRFSLEVARNTLQAAGLSPSVLTGALVWNRLEEEPYLRSLVAAMTDEQARVHFGADEILEAEHLRRGVRFFHAWRVFMLRQRIGTRLSAAQILDVGDTDGLMLKHLGKSGLGFNLSPAAVRNIQSNGVQALRSDGHGLPFADNSFDYVLCFEMLEHVESPHAVLTELARVCKPDGRLFISIPWVPRTFIHPRNPTTPRGSMHCFEFCRDDFAALVSHTPLAIRWEAVCDILGRPQTLVRHAFLRLQRNQHIVGGTFRRFQFFELSFAE